MEFLIHPRYPGRKMRRKKPRFARPPREDVYFHEKDFSDVVLGQVEKFTVGLPQTVKDIIIQGVKREISARWLVRYDIEDVLASREEYEELPGAKGLAVTAHPLQWIEDPWRVVSKFSKDAWRAVSDFQDFSNEFIWEFSVGPWLQTLGLAEIETVPKDIEIPGLRNPVRVSGRLIPKVDPVTQTTDPLALTLREFIRFRSAWPDRWTKGLLPSQAVILARFANEIDRIPLGDLPADAPVRSLVREMRVKTTTFGDERGVLHTGRLLEAGEDTGRIAKQVKTGVFNPVKEEADYVNQVSAYFKKVSKLAREGRLPPQLANLGKIINWLNREELVCLTNDLVQAGLEGSLIRTYLWRLFRGIKVKGRTLQHWMRFWVDFIKTKVPVISHFNKILENVIKRHIGPALDRIQTAVFSKLTGLVRKIGLDKVIGSIIAAGVGLATGVVGTVILALVKNLAGRFVSSILGKAWREKGKLPYVIGGCGCAFLAAPFFVILIIISAFKVPMQRMGMGGAGVAQSLVTITKAANPAKFANEATDRRVGYTVTIENKATENASITNLADNKATIPETTFDIAAGQKKVISYQATVPAGSDFAHLNTVSGTASVGGKTIPLSASAVVIVGNPPDMQPSGWPTSGEITQCPFNNPPVEKPTHTNTASIDIANNAGTEIFATHNGVAEVGDQGSAGYGKYVAVSNGVTRTVYAHFLSVSVSVGQQITFGQILGTMDDTGNSRGNHLHYEITRLVDAEGNPVPARSWMVPPYIPVACPDVFGKFISR